MLCSSNVTSIGLLSVNGSYLDQVHVGRTALKSQYRFCKDNIQALEASGVKASLSILHLAAFQRGLLGGALEPLLKGIADTHLGGLKVHLLKEVICDKLQACDFRGRWCCSQEQLQGHFCSTLHLQVTQRGCNAVHKLKHLPEDTHQCNSKRATETSSAGSIQQCRVCVQGSRWKVMLDTIAHVAHL